MRVAQLAFSLSNRAGGIFEIQVGLSLALKTLGLDVVALGLEDDLSRRDAFRWDGIPAKCLPVSGPRFFGYAKEFDRSLENCNPDLCHLQTLWMYPGIAMKKWSRKHNRPYVVTPNGMLEPWALANSGWKKRLAAFFYEKEMLRGAACLQANTLKEADDFRAYGLKNRIEIVPNGVDLAVIGKAEKRKRGKKRLLFLGRIHPKKGLVGLIRAWAALRNSQSAIRDSAEWELVIAGWDQGGHEGELKALCADLGMRIADRGELMADCTKTLAPGRSTLDSAEVLFFGPAFGQEKEALLRSADAFVLPSFSEGLPMSVLEAWAHGLPVVMTPECNLPDGFASGAALEIRNREPAASHSPPATPTKLGSDWDGLRGLIEMTNAERRAMGMRGRRIVEDKFTWPKVAARMKEIYESLL